MDFIQSPLESLLMLVVPSALVIVYEVVKIAGYIKTLCREKARRRALQMPEPPASKMN